MLNRTIGLDKRGYFIRADARHAELLINDLGLQKANACATPESEEIKGKLEENEEEEEACSEADAKRFRGLAARLNYLAQDRPSLRRASARVSSGMASPKSRHWHMLTRVGRYLRGRPEETQWFAWQQASITVKSFSDSDWGGCGRTRRSTTGGAAMLGQHMIKCWSKAQHVVSLSSGEAELYAAVRAAAETIGLASLAKDLGMELGVKISVDASAAIGTLSREGLGKAKHISVQYLWLQERIRQGEVKIEKVHTKSNPADMFTKPLSERENIGHLWRMGVESEYHVERSMGN